jgi:hypothetical protein
VDAFARRALGVVEDGERVTDLTGRQRDLQTLARLVLLRRQAVLDRPDALDHLVPALRVVLVLLLVDLLEEVEQVRAAEREVVLLRQGLGVLAEIELVVADDRAGLVAARGGGDAFPVGAGSLELDHRSTRPQQPAQPAERGVPQLLEALGRILPIHRRVPGRDEPLVEPFIELAQIIERALGERDQLPGLGLDPGRLDCPLKPRVHVVEI